MVMGYGWYAHVDNLDSNLIYMLIIYKSFKKFKHFSYFFLIVWSTCKIRYIFGLEQDSKDDKVNFFYKKKDAYCKYIIDMSSVGGSGWWYVK